MTDLTRYDINDAGEIPLSTGRYVRWEDVEDLIKDYEQRINTLETEVENADTYQEGYDDGYEEGYAEGCDQ